MRLAVLLALFAMPVTSLADKYVIYDDPTQPVSEELHAYLQGESRILTMDLTEEEAADMRKEGMIVEPVVRYKITGWVDENPAADATWAANAMKVPEAHKLSNSKGSGKKVCIVDTGIDRNHTLLKSKVISATSTVPGVDEYDRQGHGTHVASLVAGSTDIGASAISASVIAVKSLNDDGMGDSDWIAQGIETCVKKGAHVINMSLGSDTPSEVMRRAVRDARSAGVIVVAASGNEGGAISYPAAYPGVVSVGATTSSKQIASFSNRGTGLGYVAPGQGIQGARAGGGTITMSGTSMASPFVAGMIAMRLAKGSKSLGTNSLGFSSKLQGAGQVDALKTAGN